MIPQFKPPKLAKLLPSTDSIAFAEVLLAFTKAPATQEQARLAGGVTKSTMARWMKALKDRKLLYIYDWGRAGNNTVPRWSYGYKGFDALKPAAKSSALCCKEYRARKRKAEEALAIAKENKILQTKLKNGNLDDDHPLNQPRDRSSLPRQLY